MTDVEPQSLSRYQTITTLGQGGMARVLLTMSRGPAGVTKLLVVKELKDELKGDPEFVTMFLDEARIAARLNHPNVIQTYEVSTDGAHPVIVMEYLEGQPLNAVLGRVGRKNMPLDLHLHVLAQTAAGLHYAHQLANFDGTPLGLVHRDVSPQNVFVTYDGQVKVVDFGIAKAADSAGMTRAGVFKGKVAYAAPEQIVARGNVDARADVFALGVMLWEAMAGRRLTMGEPETAVMHRRVTGADPKIKDLAPDAPEDLCRICDKAMAHDPAERYQTAAEFRAAIEGYLESSRRVGAEEIGKLLRETFAEDRERVRGLVEAQVKSLKALAATGEHTAPISIPTPTATRVPSEPRESTMKVTTASAPATAAPKPEAGRVRVLLGAAAVIAAALIGFQMTRGTAPAPSDARPGASGEAAPAATVDVRIAAEPREARIYLDDAALASNPFHGAMPASALARKLRVVAPGFVTDERLVTFERDLHLELSLRPEPSAAPTSAATAAPIATASPAAPLRAAAAPSPAVIKAATTAAPGPAPGEALAPQKKKNTRSIDETF